MTRDSLATAEDVAAAMARLRKALERRLQDGPPKRPRPIRRGPLAIFDTAALGKRLRPKLERDGRGWRALADEIGVTSPDLSRIVAGQTVSAAKVFAVCDWAGINPRRFYRAPKGARKPRCFTGKALKQGEPS